MSKNNGGSIISNFIEKVWNNADLAALDELATETYEYYLGGQPPRNIAAMKEFLQAVHTAFPDWKVQVENISGDDEYIAARWTGVVTHRGIFQGIPPTGKRISVCGINMYKIEDGRISQEWEQMDSLGMLQQLGVIPPPKPAGKSLK